MQLLISVTSSKEAQAALQGGADIVDIKNPAEGALGAAAVAALRDVCALLPPEGIASAALGESNSEPGVLALALRDLQYPKQMRWDAYLDDGKGELLSGRPIRWIVFLYGGRVVPFEILRAEGASGPLVQEIRSGAVTFGHRFLTTSGRAGRAIGAEACVVMDAGTPGRRRGRPCPPPRGSTRGFPGPRGRARPACPWGGSRPGGPW